ncbi:chorion class CB protein M5H4-like [Choristoneura fumiferana]|uniref:chorion class CB protein M5H4-like n=1 Tax=Choristoneura fumiferana TaxID=7141 RepID=UPI003D15E16C
MKSCSYDVCSQTRNKFKMTFNAIILCASAFLIQSIAGQACGRISIPQPSCGNTVSVSNNGGSLIVTSVGPIAPAGIAVATDLALAGDLALSGALPFLSAVAFDGQFPTNGAASVSYGCGDGTIAITQETGNPYGNNAVCNSGLTTSQLGGCSCRS